MRHTRHSREAADWSRARRTPGPGVTLLAALLAIAHTAPVHAWGAQAHRLVAHIAAEHLTETAARHVEWLLGRERLVDVAMWADRYRSDRPETGPWHYVNIPADARTYVRERDCPVAADGARWRDCVIDRIHEQRERLADPSLGRAERATALRFLVHLVADVHQPFHAIDTARGGNDIPVSAFGSPTCGSDAAPYPCNLHGIWDATLVARRGLDDRRYLAQLTPVVARHRGAALVESSPETWTMESHALARAAILPPGSLVDEAYYRTHIASIDDRLALAGLRLAALLNRSLTAEPPAR
jgi:nuclease S1